MDRKEHQKGKPIQSDMFCLTLHQVKSRAEVSRKQHSEWILIWLSELEGCIGIGILWDVQISQEWLVLTLLEGCFC